MYDTIKFVIKESELDNKICFLEEIPCRISVDYNSLNRVVGHLSNMRVEVRGTVLIVQGSLLKYFKGYNYAECLSVWDVRKSINKLSNELNVPMRQAVINRIDVGICFSMVNVPWVYWDCLLHSDGYFRSNIKQETLYFDKYDSQLCFYDKKTEMKKNREVENLECLKKINVLRYEFRFKKVTSIFGGVVRGADLYSPVFYLRVLQKWYDGYMIIQKGFVSEVDLLRFGGKKEFQRSCVALVMGQFNLYEVLDREFAQGKINSKNKYDIKEVMKEAEKLLLDKENFISIIDELTNKVSVFYEKMKKSVENVSPYRWELLNRMADCSLRV